MWRCLRPSRVPRRCDSEQEVQRKGSGTGCVTPGRACMQGTLAKELLTNPREVLSSDGRTLKVRCSVSSFSFSAHADYAQTSSFIDTLKPAHVVLCHGNTNEMERLRAKLTKAAETHGANRKIHAPAVCLPSPLRSCLIDSVHIPTRVEHCRSPVAVCLMAQVDGAHVWY